MPDTASGFRIGAQDLADEGQLAGDGAAGEAELAGDGVGGEAFHAEDGDLAEDFVAEAIEEPAVLLGDHGGEFGGRLGADGSG